MIPNYRRRLPLIGMALYTLFLCACGYTFAPQGEHIDRRIQNIYVEPFGNKTAQAELENYMRTAFIDQILQSNRFKAVANLEQADAVIGGNVLRFTTAAISYRSNLLAAQERAFVVLEISFRDLQTGKTLWSSRTFSGQLDYTLADDINLIPPARKIAFTKLAKDTAENAYNLMMSNF